jgi:hypothetical protein
MGLVFHKKFKYFLFVFLSLFMLLSTNCFAAKKKDIDLPQTLPQTFQFFIHSKKGSCKPIKGTSNSYLLKLHDVHKSTILFSQATTSLAYPLTMGSYINGAQKVPYSINTPNALLTISCKKFKDMVVMSVGKPSYNKKNKTLICKVQLISMTTDPNSKHLKRKSLKKLPKEFKKSVLFIHYSISDPTLLGNSWDALGG